jgi:hypothetical protein
MMDTKGLKRARSMEKNNHPQGRGKDAALKKKMGPAVGNTSGNPTSGGKIKRSK